MQLPGNIKVNETNTGYFWFDQDGILNSISKENPPDLTPEEEEEDLQLFLNKVGNKKVCILIDAKHAKPSSPSERKRAAKILNEVTTALAVIVHNPMGRMVVNIFIGLQKPPYPMKIFKPGEEEKARTWLKKHL